MMPGKAVMRASAHLCTAQASGRGGSATPAEAVSDDAGRGAAGTPVGGLRRRAPRGSARTRRPRRPTPMGAAASPTRAGRVTATSGRRPGVGGGSARCGRASPPSSNEKAPISVAPRRRCAAVPTRSSARRGGSSAGERRGGGSAKRGGPAGLGVPAPMSGLPGRGRGSSAEASPGSSPRSVPAHSGGTPVEPSGTQLPVPAITRRPADQRTSCSTSTRSGPPPARAMTLLCISMLSSPSKSRNAPDAAGPRTRVLLTKR